MPTENLAPALCLHRVISAPPESSNGTCLECGEDVDVRLVERRWQEEEPEPAAPRLTVGRRRRTDI